MAFRARNQLLSFSGKALATCIAVGCIHSYRKSILLESPSEKIRPKKPRNTTAFWTSLSNDLPRQLCAFIDASPSPHHVVENAKALLQSQGFIELREEDEWAIQPGGKYFVNRNKDSGTSLAAFTVGSDWRPGDPFAIVGTHVDSPCLRLKPRSSRASLGYMQLGVELYGGGLWHTWFDRDLGLAGRVIVRTGLDTVETRLVNINEPILRVPSLAAHYRKHNPLQIDLERHLVPVLGSQEAEEAWLKSRDSALNDEAFWPHGPGSAVPPDKDRTSWPANATVWTSKTVAQKISEDLGVSPNEILNLDLCLYDLQPAALGGAYDEYVYAARLDNLMMSFCGLVGFTRSVAAEGSLSSDKSVRMLAMFDHEEIGSTGAGSAKSTFIPHILKRLCSEAVRNNSVFGGNGSRTQNDAAFERSMARSFFLSADMTHATHPAHIGVADNYHRTYINDGICISSTPRNAFMRNTPGTYILSEIACRSDHLMGKAGDRIKIQIFVNPNDITCGSTLGPLFGTVTGIRTMDVGNCQLSMHSAREMAGAKDVNNAVALLQGFYKYFVEVDEQTKVK